MDVTTMVEEIKSDLGNDIVSLGISDNTIVLKIKEAVRKISSYSPYIKVQTYNIDGDKVVLSENTVMVSQVLTDDVSGSVDRNSPIYDEKDLFNATRYIYNYSGNTLRDPYIYMMNITELRTLQSMVEIKDWFYDKESHTLFLSNYSKSSVTVKSLEKYETLEQITDIDIIQTIKEYSLALCKIIEGNIRRKLQSAPGAIAMDGDSLVSEGISEKAKLDEQIPKTFSYLRFGIKA